MPDKLNLEQIRAFWTEQAKRHGQSPASSWSDEPMIDLEIRELIKRLRDGQKVLDVGCANGYTTLGIASERRVAIRGVDYIPEMIDQARLRLEAAGKLRGRAEFAVGDAMKLSERDASYDAVVMVRVLINLREWPRQAAALRECARVLKPGGTLLLSEATVQGWRKLNAFRAEWGLPAIGMPAFNEYLDEEKVIEAAAPELELVEKADFASTYYVGSRVLKPLLIQALGAKIDVADPLMEWNRWFARLPAAGDYGTQKLFHFRKRAAAPRRKRKA